MTCGRCRAQAADETCWYCGNSLCADCWEEHGHCGHAVAEVFNARSRAWKPGDPMMQIPRAREFGETDRFSDE